MGTTEMLVFMAEHGFNSISPTPELSFWRVTGDYEEELISTNPFRAKFTLRIDDDALTLTVDVKFDIIEAVETKVSDTQ